jgi:hypothetical protein
MWVLAPVRLSACFSGIGSGFQPGKDWNGWDIYGHMGKSYLFLNRKTTLLIPVQSISPTPDPDFGAWRLSGFS